MEKYESKQVQINQPAAIIYNTISDFSNFTPILKDKVEEWDATSDTCSFKVKGFTVKLKIVDKEQDKFVKVTGDEGTPFDFNFWTQLKQLTPDDTRMRLVLHVKLNMMMKMMVGNKIQSGLDRIVDQIAAAFNNMPR